jgi:serine/threonine-protein kinase
VPETLAGVERKCRICGAPLYASFAFCSRCGSPAERQDVVDPFAEQVRSLFGSDLAIQHSIGRGAMAVVYAAFDPALKRSVAVKVLLPDIAEDPAMVQRFRHEAQTVASLRHPNVVTVFGLRTSERLSAIVMELIDGRSLDAVLRESSPLPLPVAGFVLSQTAAALQHAHEHGIVHRDVKPANVLLDRSGRAVVSDFGIARREGFSGSTASGLLLGTAAYMSPEQCVGQRADALSDQYSFGVMAYELLSGRLPFSGRVERLVWSHVHETAVPLGQLRPDLPFAVVSFVMRALEKDPARRHPSLKDAERTLRSLVPDEATATTELVRISLPKVVQAARAKLADGARLITPLAIKKAVRATGARLEREGGRPWIWVGAAFVLVCLAIVTFLFRR